MGHYLEAKYRLDTIIEDNLDGGPTQIAKIHQLRSQVIAAANLQTSEHFKPWEKHHNGWGAIELKMGKGPVSESFLFLITTVPVLMIVVYFSNQVAGRGWGAFCHDQFGNLWYRFVWNADWQSVCSTVSIGQRLTCFAQ